MSPEIKEAGTVLRCDGPFVDVRFDVDASPDVFDALAPAGADARLRVTQRLGDGVVRCVTLGDVDVAVGQEVVNRTARGGTYQAAVADGGDIAGIVGAGDAKATGLCETGIKPIDLFCPLPASGSVALFGTAGVGKMVLTMELGRRLAGRPHPQIYYLADRSEPSLIRDLQDDDASFDRDIVWLMSDHATDPVFASSNDVFDVSIYCGPLLAIHDSWPAVEPTRSHSRADVGERHARLADEARALLVRARELTYDAELWELLGSRAYPAARRRAQQRPERIAALQGEDRATAERAWRLEAFLTTPFDIARDLTGVDGEVVALDDTLDGVEAILAGRYDDADPASLRMIGKLPQ